MLLRQADEVYISLLLLPSKSAWFSSFLSANVAIDYTSTMIVGYAYYSYSSIRSFVANLAACSLVASGSVDPFGAFVSNESHCVLLAKGVII